MRLVYPNLIDSRCVLTSGETHFFHRIYCFTTFIHLFKDTSRTEMIWRVWVYRRDEVYFNLFHISLSINCGTTRRTKANAAISYSLMMYGSPLIRIHSMSSGFSIKLISLTVIASDMLYLPLIVSSLDGSKPARFIAWLFDDYGPCRMAVVPSFIGRL